MNKCFGIKEGKKIAIVNPSAILTTVLAITLKREDMTFCKFSYDRNKMVRAVFFECQTLNVCKSC